MIHKMVCDSYYLTDDSQMDLRSVDESQIWANSDGYIPPSTFKRAAEAAECDAKTTHNLGEILGFFWNCRAFSRPEP